MDITPRLKKILMIMLEREQVISVKELADLIGVSKRTVQRELEYVGSSLKEYGITFETKTGKGVWLSGGKEGKERLFLQLKEEDHYDVSNREERRKRLVLEILKDKGLKKLFYYASQFQVSEATVSSDLEAVEGWLQAHQLIISRKPGSGIEVNGTEESYRRAIRAFIEENINTSMMREFYEVKEPENIREIYGSGIGQILQEDILKKVVTCLEDMGEQRVMNLTESSYVGLVLHISIAISRMVKNEMIGQKPQEWELPQDEDYELAGKIADRLGQEFSIKIPKLEQDYICLHIKGAKHQGMEWNGGKTMEIERKEILDLVNEMINAYDRENAFIFKQDSEFIQGLLAHLQPTFVRLIHGMKISNPVLGEIRVSYPEIFERSRRAGAVLEQWIGKPVPEEEIGFLTIHFGAAQVRADGRKEQIRQVTVGIVCASGIGISRLMLSKLDKIFRDRIHMETYGGNDITPYIASRTDFFVSSVPMRQVDADILAVNPLLDKEDVEKIREKVYHYERLPKKEHEETLFSMQLEQVTIMAMQIKTILRYLEVVYVSKDITFEELVAAISEKMSPYKDRQVMIQEAIEERERLGSQIFAEFGFALLHTRTKGVTRPGFGIWMTKDSKAFSDPYFKGIGVVLVMLLPVDDNIKVNSEIMGYISSMLIEDYDFLTVVTGGNKEEIKAVLSENLKKFFHQYLNKMQ